MTGAEVLAFRTRILAEGTLLAEGTAGRVFALNDRLGLGFATIGKAGARGLSMDEARRAVEEIGRTGGTVTAAGRERFKPPRVAAAEQAMRRYTQ